MKTFIKPEMFVHVPLCTHKMPSLVIVFSEDESSFQTEINRHSDIHAEYKKTKGLLDSLRECPDHTYDIVLLNENCKDSAVLAHMNRILKQDGLMVMDHPSLDDQESNKALMEMLGNYFKIIMPYYAGNGETLLLCSKEYHPTADLILQRSDLLEGLQFYNCDVHTAVFAMPQYVRKNYLGIIRN